jgi:hypothetical protein
MARIAALGLLLLLAPLAQAQTVVAFQTDAISTPGKKVVVQAKFKRGSEPVANRQVVIEALGSAYTVRTDASGVAQVEVKPSAVGAFPVTARMGEARSSGTLHVIAATRPVVVCDLDETLSNLPFMSMVHSSAPAPTYPGAVALLRDLAATHTIVYLTARPDTLVKKTRAFLAAHDFPAGPLLRDDLRGISDDGRQKLATLQAMKARGVKLDLGIGNTKHDALAYEGAGMRSFIRTTEALPAEYAASVRFPTYNALRRKLVDAGVLSVGIVSALPGN